MSNFVITDEIQKELRGIYEKFREAEKLVVSELSKNPSEDEIKKMDEAFTAYYHAIDDIRYDLGLLLDKFDSGKLDVKS